MPNDLDAMNELHWLIDMVQTIEVGLVVLDRNFNIQLWNGFMENHSGVSPNDIKGDNLFQRFPALPEQWLKQKMESVFLLKNQAFISWEQRPYVFKFKNYRPITGRAEFMYQNITLLPLASLTGQISHISMIVYDVTDMAINKMQLEAVGDKLQQHNQTDALTLLLNRRHWLQQVQLHYEQFARYHEPVSMMMINLDHLKQLNESKGHVAGDRAIQHVAHILKKHLRDTDIGGRFGGETLGIMLSQTDNTAAFTQAEQIRRDIEQAEFSYNNQTVKVTVSIGIYQLDDELNSPDKWLDKVDEALALAKVSGRNCVKTLPALS
ncbi:sensor domain-containing diguanylate cyclase [Shewanella sp. C32]|uniref:diguanylate cyclase n=1 Tax=Shewanella electrica TaxID=515560 RepID=A0ABT2FNZ9_9GAMM|nr:sensor domain-containing diguanylate cyclase [Shewanella electrica]MCH1925684.1 sensor domain-containing diguanylate cyclase [Shewanella electrica]MCS4558067.1 sensor domain-containing diguanylate cyclase [Shewanella electrica]